MGWIACIIFWNCYRNHSLIMPVFSVILYFPITFSYFSMYHFTAQPARNKKLLFQRTLLLYSAVKTYVSVHDSPDRILSYPRITFLYCRHNNFTYPSMNSPDFTIKIVDKSLTKIKKTEKCCWFYTLNMYNRKREAITFAFLVRYLKACLNRHFH